jgi:hypothetical protein
MASPGQAVGEWIPIARPSAARADAAEALRVLRYRAAWPHKFVLAGLHAPCAADEGFGLVAAARRADAEQATVVIEVARLERFGDQPQQVRRKFREAGGC